MGNATVEHQWPACVGCAILHRSFGKSNTSIPDACSKCFEEFCWDGTIDDTKAAYSPPMKLRAERSDSEESSAKALSVDFFGLLTATVFIIQFLV